MSDLDDVVLNASLRMDSERLAVAAQVATFAARCAYMAAIAPMEGHTVPDHTAVLMLMRGAFAAAWDEHLHGDDCDHDHTHSEGG